MSAWLGDFRVGKTIRKMWNSNAVAGESITRATNGTISVYKDGGTTQSTTGVTDTEDFDSLTGVHLVVIDTSADGTFYSAGSDFEVVLSGATIDGKAINATLFSFSLENRSALMPTTDGRKLDVSAGGEAGIDWANIGNATNTNNLSGTTIKTATDVETDTADIQARLPAALVSGRIDASVGAMAANVMTAAAAAADLATELQSGLATAAALATAQTSIDDLPTNSELATALGAADDAVLAQVALVKAVTDKIDDTLEDDGGTYRFTTNALEQAPTGGSAPTADEIADEVETRTIAAVTVVNGLANNSVTAAALAADAGTEIGNAVWASGTRVLTAGTNIVLAKGTGVTGFTDIDAAGVRTAVGLAGASLDTQLDSLPTNAELATALAGADDAVLSAIAGLVAPDNAGIAAIKAKTDNLPSDPADQSLVIAATDALATLIGDVPTNAELAAALATADDAVLAAIAALSIPTANQNADALLDRTAGVETNRTLRQAMRLMLAVLAGKASGLETTEVVYRDTNDTVNRVVATVDADGNRSAVTLNAG